MIYAAYVQALTRRGICIEFVQEQLLFTGEDSPMANLMLSVMAHPKDSSALDSRKATRGNRPRLKKRGVYLGRIRALSPDGLADARRRVDAGEKKAQIARELGVSRETLYHYFARRREFARVEVAPNVSSVRITP
jgi:DNA invertase Pin-like site-specific DNA recombinase